MGVTDQILVRYSGGPADGHIHRVAIDPIEGPPHRLGSYVYDGILTAGTNVYRYTFRPHKMSRSIPGLRPRSRGFPRG